MWAPLESESDPISTSADMPVPSLFPNKKLNPSVDDDLDDVDLPIDISTMVNVTVPTCSPIAMILLWKSLHTRHNVLQFQPPLSSLQVKRCTRHKALTLAKVDYARLVSTKAAVWLHVVEQWQRVQNLEKRIERLKAMRHQFSYRPVLVPFIHFLGSLYCVSFLFVLLSFLILVHVHKH